MYGIGVDVGSTYTKYCVMSGSKEILERFTEQTSTGQREYFAKKMSQLQSRYPDSHIISCGYGKNNVEGYRTVNELTALAAGAGCQCPGMRVVLDIGGQDTKVILQENGKLKRFFTNEKCAAGCGMFLRSILQQLGRRFVDIDMEKPVARPEFQLSTVCAVFAQTEVVEAVAAGVDADSVIRAVLRQIFTQAKALLNKVEGDSIALSGGLAELKGVQSFAEQILKQRVFVPPGARYLSAIGCGVLACPGSGAL